MDWYFLAVALVLLIVIMIANTYLLAHNAHPQDSKFGSNIFMRVVVVNEPFIQSLQNIGYRY